MERRRKSPSGLNSIPLLYAVLCADCEVISDSAGETCEICGSRSLLNLGRVLGGSIEGQRAIKVHIERSEPRNMFTVLVNRDVLKTLQDRRKRKQMGLFADQKR